MTARYQVVGECAHAVVTDVSGVSAMQLLYKGAFLPDNVDPDRLKHLLETGLAVEVEDEDDAIAPNAAVAQDGNVGIPSLNQAGIVDEDPEVAAKRAEAKAKLPADGSAPDGRASKDTWVEYAVAQGMDREEAEKADKSDLVAALKK